MYVVLRVSQALIPRPGACAVGGRMHPASSLRLDDHVDGADGVDERRHGHLVDFLTPRAQEIAKTSVGGIAAIGHRSSQVGRGSAPSGVNYSELSAKSTLCYRAAIIPTHRGDPLTEDRAGGRGHAHLGQR